MGRLLRNLRHVLAGERDGELERAAAGQQRRRGPIVPIRDDDPLVALLRRAPGGLLVEEVEAVSPALTQLRSGGVKLAVPLVNRGALVGVLSLGPQLSGREYSSDDRRLLANLAAQAAPALRVAQLAGQQEAEAEERERPAQELRIAQLIQRSFLPRAVPEPHGWTICAHYQAARAVGGDFYDFLDLPGGLLGLVIGDVTDKGVPAAMVMASTRSVVRAAALQFDKPGAVLAEANDILCKDMPPNMFATCLYAVLDPAVGALRFANAGHNLPCLRHGDEVAELRARGMPLGLMPGMTYEEHETSIAPGDSLLLYSDGLTEAHNPAREMFGSPRLHHAMRGCDGQLIELLLEQLQAFAGQGWEQEDDVTLVTLARCADA